MNFNTKSHLAVYGLAAVAVFAASSARAELIDLNLTPNPSGEDMSGAAVLGAAGDVWNNTYTSQPVGSVTDLTDSTGTDAHVTFNETGFVGVDQNGTVNSSGVNDTTGTNGGFEFALYNTFLHPNNPTNTGTISFSGLSASTEYQIVLYSFNAAGGGRNVTETTNGVTNFLSDQANYGFVSTSTGTGTYAGNYLTFDVTTDATGAFEMDFSGNGQNAISGIQVEDAASAAPEPSTWCMLLAGLTGLIWMGRRRLMA